MLALDDGSAGVTYDATPPKSFGMTIESWRRLFADCAAGRSGALEELYDVAAGRLYGFAVWATGSPDDAQDVVAETFVRVAEQGPRLSGVRDPRSWLLTVTRRLSVDVARHRRRHPTEPLQSAEMLTAPTGDPDRALDARRASKLLARLSRKHREVVFLRHYGECTFAAIGDVLGIPTFTAASRYRLALRRLRLLMEEIP